jgi:hypothetical protein
LDELHAICGPATAEPLEENWSPLESLAKGELDWLEQMDPCKVEHLKSAILTTERATLTHLVPPLHTNESAHVVGRLLRLLRSAYVELHHAAAKAP